MATARPDTWMPIYWGDYAKDTGHLSAAHHGAYFMLIKHYWVTGQPLPNDDVQLWRIACADSLPHWRKLKPVVLAFFEEKDGYLCHGRIEKELEAAGRHAERRTEMARKAAAARWRKPSGPHALSNAPRNAGGMRPAGEHSLTRTLADENSTTSEIITSNTQPIDKPVNKDAPSNAASMPDAMPGECPPPSPSTVTTASSVSDSARIDEAEWEPEGQADDLEPPDFLKRKPIAGRAQPVPEDWKPSPEIRHQLARARPDLTLERIEQRTVVFRNWCRENNKRSFDFNSSWFNFLVQTHEQPHSDKSERTGLSAVLAGYAEAGSG